MTLTAVATTTSPGLFLPPSQSDRRDFAQELRQQTLACRLHREKLGIRKTLTREQIRTMATTFEADVDSLSAAKKLIDTADPAYRAVRNVLTRAGAYWKANTVPYPDPGIRLIRRNKVEAFVAEMEQLAEELDAAALVLQEKYAELRENARTDLGTLFNEDDYPGRVDDQFMLEWDFPSIEPPEYLKNVHPELYEKECQRIRGRMEEAVALTEQALAEQLSKLVIHLVERLKGDVDGKPKTFKDASIKNLTAFFEEFRSIDMGSNAELGKIVDQAQQIVNGITPDDLRASTDLRTRVSDQLSEVSKRMDEMMIARPKRAIRLEDDE